SLTISLNAFHAQPLGAVYNTDGRRTASRIRSRFLNYVSKRTEQNSTLLSARCASVAGLGLEWHTADLPNHEVHMATCPKCNSDEVYVSDFAPLQAADHFVRLFNGEGNNLKPEVSLCTNCGYMEISVAKEDLPKVPKLVKTKYWKKKA